MITTMDFKQCVFILLYVPYSVLLASFTLEPVTEHCDSDLTGAIWICNYLPPDIPDRFSTVQIYIKDFDIQCYNTSFLSPSWHQVKSLQLLNLDWTIDKNISFYDYCFRNLINMTDLDIHIGSRFHLSSNAFSETNTLRRLSFANCIRVSWKPLLEALDGDNKIPNLTDLDLSQVATALGSVNIQHKFVDALGRRNITRINLSGMQVSFLDLTSVSTNFKHLSHINASSMNINEFTYDGSPDDIKRIKELDISYTVLPKSSVVAGHFKLINVHIRYDEIHKGFNDLFYIRTLFANGTFNKATFELYNCKLIMNAYVPTVMETIVLKDNHFRHIDLDVTGDSKYMNTTFMHVDVSGNGMNFLHPAIFLLAPNLQTVRMSDNNFNSMLKISPTQFEILFKFVVKLKLIDLSNNGLELLPEHQFVHNTELEEIYLSNNLIQQVHWDMSNLTILKILDLRNNRITLLDAASLYNLNILIANVYNNYTLDILLDNNPIACSRCESKPFITWLTKSSSMVQLSKSKLTCTQENGERGDIDTTQVDRVKSICDRMTIIIACVASIGTVIICSVIVMYVLLRRRKIRLRRLKLNQLLANIQQGDGEFEFVVMLSYNNQEEDFIRQNVLDPLNETLQTITGVDRELVLTGDQHFRPGFMVHNEIASSLERVSLVLLLITNEFCTSGFCLSELDQAWIQRKPMIFMFKDEVDINLMTPIMKTIYRENVRILWTMEDGEYVLKTTWENVCDAILELIIK